MNQAISSSSSSSPEPVGAGESLNRSVLKGTRMTYSRVIGALFLLGFLSYGVGNALVASVTGASGFLSAISAHQITLVLGAFLMLLNSVVVVGMGVLFFPILENHGKRTALAYLASRMVEAVLLAVGVLSLLMIEYHGLPDRRDVARTRRHIPVCAAVPCSVDPSMAGGLGLDRLRDSPDWLHC